MAVLQAYKVVRVWIDFVGRNSYTGTKEAPEEVNAMYPKYPYIDLQETGRRIKSEIQKAGLPVREVQEYLQLSCPQPVYRWFKGQILPSLNHLYALSQLLHVHMEDLLVVKDLKLREYLTEDIKENQIKRLLFYYRALCNAA